MAHVGTAFFAHTSGADKAGWEPLTDHLALTARLAEGFARPFGLGDLAGLAGLLHDLGKYQPEFQARLNGAVDAVDHSQGMRPWSIVSSTVLEEPVTPCHADLSTTPS